MRRKMLLSGIVVSVLLCFSLVVSVEAASMWSQTYGGTEFDGAYSLVATSDGGYTIAGYTQSFGAGNDDFWLVKTDTFGNMEWNQTYGGTLGQFAHSLVATSDGGYAIAGDAISLDPGLVNAWFVKTDVNGVMEWNRTYEGTGYDQACSLVATSDDGYAIAGYTSSFGAGSADFWLIKTDETGVVPEYSSLLIPALVLTTTAFIIINKKLPKTPAQSKNRKFTYKVAHFIQTRIII